MKTDLFIYFILRLMMMKKSGKGKYIYIKDARLKDQIAEGLLIICFIYLFYKKEKEKSLPK